MTTTERTPTRTEYVKIHGGARMRAMFDRNRELVVVKPFKFTTPGPDGKMISRNWKVGEVFDSKTASTRRLRQMYDQRFLKHDAAVKMLAPEEPKLPPSIETITAAAAAGTPIKPIFKDLSTTNLRRWLEENHAPAEPRTPRIKLIELAASRWKELYDGKPSEATEAAEAQTDDGHKGNGVEGS